MQQTIVTNRDIYKCILALEEQFGGALLPSLESYLLSLWDIASAHPYDLIRGNQLVNWLEAAFTHSPPPFDENWLDYLPPQPFHKRIASFANWEDVILFQAADLHRMAESGELSSPNRYDGVISPSGALWYNFDPITYLECAVRGMLGGFHLTQSARFFVHSNFALTSFTWSDMILFAKYGQMYE